MNSSTRKRESQSSSRSSNTRNKKPVNSNYSKQFAQSLSLDNLSAPDRSTSHDPPPYSSPTDVMAASQSSQSNCLSSKAISNSTVCFKCSKTGYISSTCTTAGKPPRLCYACSGFKKSVETVRLAVANSHYSLQNRGRSRVTLCRPLVLARHSCFRKQ